MEESEKQPSQNASEETDQLASLQAQLAECRAQLEHWQGVATICEMSKQEELRELQKQCDQEIDSLQEALRETASQYEARISVLLAERAQWRCAVPGTTDIKNSPKKSKNDDRMTPLVGVRWDGEIGQTAGQKESQEGGTIQHGEQPEHNAGERTEEECEVSAGEGVDFEGGLSVTEGYFSHHCDNSSLSSFSLDTPSLPRRPAPQEDTASLVSTGTLVPEAIYLPPAGHRLVTHSDWDALHAQVAELQGELSRLKEERAELEKELASHTSETQRQVSILQSQIQTSEALLQDLQKSFTQSQSTVQGRLAELSLSHRRVCSELSRLKGGEPESDREKGHQSDISLTVQGAHCEERLRIEIVNLKEQLEQRTEDCEVLEVQLSSLKTETDRIQSLNEKLKSELQECRTELSGLRMALSHLRRDCKTQSNDKSALEQQCLQLRSQVISLRSQLDSSQAVQRDFVQLSQSLQVQLELIRQAESMDQVRQALGEELASDSAKVTDAT